MKLFHGANNYLSEQQLQSFLAGKQAQYFDGSEFSSLDALALSSGSYSLFDQVDEYIVVRHFFSNKKTSLHEVFLEQSASFDLTKLVFFEEKEVDKRSKLYKFIKKNGEVIGSTHLDTRELGGWLQKQLQLRKLSANSQVQALLLERVGDNQHILLSELEKLALLLSAEGRSQIELADCEIVSYVDREHQVWALLDAISARNKTVLMHEFQKLYHGDEDFQYLLTMLAKQLKILYLLKDPAISRDEIVSEFKIHPFTLTKAGKYLHKFELSTLKMLFRKLFDLDLAVKQGKIEPGLGLNLFLLSI